MPTLNPEFDAALHRRLYVDQDPSQLVAKETAAATEPQWRAWREAMNAAIQGRKPAITPATGDIRLHAKDARVHGQTMHYEPQSNKNVLGYWTNVADWADWGFVVATAGTYEVEIQQGCGGAEVAVEINGQTLKFTVQETGHFQHMIQRVIGQVELAASQHTLAVKPQTKPRSSSDGPSSHCAPAGPINPQWRLTGGDCLKSEDCSKGRTTPGDHYARSASKLSSPAYYVGARRRRAQRAGIGP